MSSKNYTKLAYGEIEGFNKKFLKALDFFKNKKYPTDYERYIDKIKEFRKLIKLQLNITNKKDLKKITASVNISKILIEESIENKDFECLVSSLYSLKFKLKLLGYINYKNIKIGDMLNNCDEDKKKYENGWDSKPNVTTLPEIVKKYKELEMKNVLSEYDEDKNRYENGWDSKPNVTTLPEIVKKYMEMKKNGEID